LNITHLLLFLFFVKLFDKYYRVLNLNSDASNAQIKNAYRNLAKQYHPDRSGTSATRGQFIEVNEAYEILMRRDDYVRDAIKRYQARRSRERSTAAYARREPRGATHSDRATGYADMRFQDFEKSPIYKTAVVVNSYIDYIFVSLGVIMIVSPIYGYISQLGKDVPVHKKAEFHLLPIFIGAFFLIGVWYFLFKNKEA